MIKMEQTLETKIEHGISRREMLKGMTAALALYPILKSSSAEGCIGDMAANTFYRIIVEPNISNPELLKIIDKNISRICELFETTSFIEVSGDEITAHE